MAAQQPQSGDGRAPDRGSEAASPLSGRTAWARNLAAPVRDFLSTETGSAAVLLAGVLTALLWANTDLSSYESVWHTVLSIRLGAGSITADLRHWVNEGLMTFFFLVVGLEAKREFDVGELRERRRVAVPVLAAAGGSRPQDSGADGQRSWPRERVLPGAMAPPVGSRHAPLQTGVT